MMGPGWDGVRSHRARTGVACPGDPFSLGAPKGMGDKSRPGVWVLWCQDRVSAAVGVLGPF